MTVAQVVQDIQRYIFLALTVLALVGALASLVHAVVTRPDAYTAVDAQSKVFWVVVLAVSSVVSFFLGAGALLMGILGIFYLAAVIAVIVYLVDVRPRVDEIQGKSWFRKSA